jgi:hypothetical protein
LAQAPALEDVEGEISGVVRYQKRVEAVKNLPFRAIASTQSRLKAEVTGDHGRQR